jgi:hypothetical protein
MLELLAYRVDTSALPRKGLWMAFLRASRRVDHVLWCAVAVLCCVQALLGEGAEGAAEDDEEQEEEEEINLHAAASDGNTEQLQQLLEDADCDVNQADEEGRTALHFAGAAALETLPQSPEHSSASYKACTRNP